jgi:glycolate oxidase FAD binding subunit
VITVRAGTRLDDLERVMAHEGQMLAFEPPHFAPGATIGGTVASGLSGPRRPYAGAVRDLVLGVRVVDGTGQALTFGGRVMKNVAGFDVARAMTGAMGTLGVLLDISLKCLPLPRTTRTLAFEMTAPEAIARMNAWSAEPLPISATCHVGSTLHVRLSGATPAVDAAVRRLGGVDLPDADVFWPGIRDHHLPFFAPGAPLWRVSVRSTAPLAAGDEALIEWGGALRWIRADADAGTRLRQHAAEHGGHATLFRTSGARSDVFQPLPEALLAIHRRLKHTFDPHGILNPGRLYPSL